MCGNAPASIFSTARLPTLHPSSVSSCAPGERPTLRVWKTPRGHRTWSCCAVRSTTCEHGSMRPGTYRTTFGPSGPISNHCGSGSTRSTARWIACSPRPELRCAIAQCSPIESSSFRSGRRRATRCTRRTPGSRCPCPAGGAARLRRARRRRRTRTPARGPPDRDCRGRRAYAPDSAPGGDQHPAERCRSRRQAGTGRRRGEPGEAGSGRQARRSVARRGDEDAARRCGTGVRGGARARRPAKGPGRIRGRDRPGFRPAASRRWVLRRSRCPAGGGEGARGAFVGDPDAVAARPAPGLDRDSGTGGRGVAAVSRRGADHQRREGALP